MVLNATRMLWQIGWAVGWLRLVVGYQATPENQAAASLAKPVRTVVPAASPLPVVPAAPYTGYHRYRGTVGSQPVVVELLIRRASKAGQQTCSGSYYYEKHGGQLSLQSRHDFGAGAPLVLAETDAERPTGRWQATQPIGAVLAGMWRSPTGKLLPFSLREDYTDGQGQLMAVSYELVEATAKVPCRPERDPDETKAAYRARIATAEHGYSRQLLHLLGPDTLRPSLQSLQCPVPAARRQLARAAAQEDDGCTLYTASLDVDYNAYGLLAWTEYSMEEVITGARPRHSIASAVYDLRTGHTLKLEDIFRPDSDTLLQRLITRSILRNDSPDIQPEKGQKMPTHAVDLAPLPTTFSLTNAGLEFAYYVDEFAQLNLIESSPIVFSVPVPYAELLPLLRPDSPVARLLRARGMWPPARR
jgi:hypothetical protein